MKRYTRLKQLIIDKGMTYKTLSELTGIPLGTLCTKINGYGRFTTREAAYICRALGINEIMEYF